MDPMSYVIIFGCSVLLAGMFVFRSKMNKRARERGPVMGKTVNGKGKKPRGGTLRRDAKITDVTTEKKSGSLKTVVTFEDGYTYTTYFAKTMTTTGLMRVNTRSVVDAEVREKIITQAIAEHNIDAE